MKVLRVINSLDFGGAERSIVTNVPIHIENGIDMDVLLLNGKQTFFKDELEMKNVKVFTLEFNNIYNPLLVLKLIKYLKKYDIIHAHLFPSFYWLALAKIISFSKTTIVFTEHSTSNRRRYSWIFKILDKIIYHQYKVIICISQAAKESLVQQINHSSKIIVIENGIDFDKLKASSKLLPDELSDALSGKKVIVQIAGFRKSKDQDTVIKTISKLDEDFCLILVGDGERKNESYNLASSLNVLDRVFFVGFQENIAPYIAVADVIVMSSHWEGFGRSAVEGMSFGKPVIATNVKGLAEVVKDAGLLFEVGDMDKLSELILKLLNNKSFYEEISNKCYLKSQKYEVGLMIKNYENIYYSISQSRL